MRLDIDDTTRIEDLARKGFEIIADIFNEIKSHFKFNDKMIDKRIFDQLHRLNISLKEYETRPNDVNVVFLKELMTGIDLERPPVIHFLNSVFDHEAAHQYAKMYDRLIAEYENSLSKIIANAK
jgi:hypothetical protein